MVKALFTQAVLGVLAWSTFTAEAQPGCESLYNSMLQTHAEYKECADQNCIKPRNCLEIWKFGQRTSKIYTIFLLEGTVETPVRVYCDMDTAGGGWLVFQRRQDGSEDFYRNWANYTDGFGDLQNEFWLGNKYIHMLTSGGQYKLRIDLGDFEGETRHAEYTTFGVGDPSSNYTLSVSGYSGDVADSLLHHNGHKFSTKDQDNDEDNTVNCAIVDKGAWWYTTCFLSNLNGQYLSGASDTGGIIWYNWRGYGYSLKFTEMKFKPT